MSKKTTQNKIHFEANFILGRFFDILPPPLPTSFMFVEKVMKKKNYFYCE